MTPCTPSLLPTFSLPPMIQYQREPFHLRSKSGTLLFSFNWVELVAQKFVHLEHVDRVLLEHGLELLVAQNLSSVTWILKLVGLDMFPEFLDDLWAG